MNSRWPSYLRPVDNVPEQGQSFKLAEFDVAAESQVVAEGTGWIHYDVAEDPTEKLKLAGNAGAGQLPSTSRLIAGEAIALGWVDAGLIGLKFSEGLAGFAHYAVKTAGVILVTIGSISAVGKPFEVRQVRKLRNSRTTAGSV